jgi:hypothetical protein
MRWSREPVELNHERIHAAQREVGHVLEARRRALVAASGRPSCVVLACPRRVANVVETPGYGGHPITVCATHTAAIAKATSVGKAALDGATTTPYTGQPLRRRPPPPEIDATRLLDWGKGFHWNYRPHRCIHCGQPALLKDDAGQPAHKTCTEGVTHAQGTWT